MAEDWDKVPDLLTVKKTVEAWSDDRFKVKGSTITFQGQQLPDSLAARALEMIRNGESPRPFFRFWERLQKNPSYRSVQQLWDFLNHKNIPLTPDGCFLAYKGIRADFTDCHTGKVDNRPGAVNEMPRNQISDDPQKTCHVGFHVGAYGYAGSFGARTIVCKVDPENVVCVPYDHSQQKMRVCKYVVLGNYGAKLPDSLLDEDVKVPSKPPARKKKTDPLPRRRVANQWKKYDNMGVVELMEQGIMPLRTYASKALNIVGASKIPGGKATLVQAILQARYQPESL